VAHARFQQGHLVVRLTRERGRLYIVPRRYTRAATVASRSSLHVALHKVILTGVVYLGARAKDRMLVTCTDIGGLRRSGH